MLENVYMMVAITNKTNAIGKDGDMIYHLPQDLKYFKETTQGHTIICGRKTYYSFPRRPLPNRKNIVLTRSENDIEGASLLNSREELIDYAKSNPEEIIFIVGGDTIYHQFLDLASKLYITEIDEDDEVEADSFFPEIDKDKWIKESESDYYYDDNAPRYKFVVYKLKEE